MAKKLTVFLSSTGADLADYRVAVMKRLQKSDYIHCDGMENFGARAESPEDFCRKRAQECDVYVGLIGFYRGSEVPGDNAQRSFTEMEYATATQAGKPRLMYIVPDDFKPSAPPQTKKAAQQQAAFRKAVLKSHVVSNEFQSPETLAGAIAVDLMNLLAEKIAAGIAPAEGALPGQQRAVTDAVAAVVEAAETDDRMARALRLLAENKVADAEPLLREFAEERAQKVERDRARIEKDSKEAAAAYRHLGAIAGFADPKAAVDAYRKACELDADDIDAPFWLGWLQMERGYLEEASACLQRVWRVAEKEARDWHRYWAGLGLGDIEASRGSLDKAREAYDGAKSLADRLAKADPGNAEWQYGLGISNERIGTVLAAQGDLAGALKSYQAKHDIIGGLAKSDPGNALWQRDLSVSHNKIGDVLVAQGKLAEALQAFRADLAIAERLAKAEPGNALWQRDLSVSHNKIGGVLVAQGKVAEALQAFRADLVIAERLAQTDPSNVQWQVDVLWSNWRLARHGDDAARRWELIVSTLRKLKGEDKLTAEQATWLPHAEAELAKAQKEK